jgi:outer membrane receptor for ferrienterochelin and colicins
VHVCIVQRLYAVSPQCRKAVARRVRQLAGWCGDVRSNDSAARIGAVVVLLTFPALAVAQETRLADLSLEQLMNIKIETVVGASERLQPVTEAPSSVTIVTADDIARYGYRTLADILRSVRGLYVSDDRNYSYVGVRGFERPGDYNSRVLLLVNGHRVNDSVYDQAGIGAEFGIDPAMFDRVEIIRGPASALYGTSAFFAVVNVITKTGAALDGASASIEDGTLGTQLARLAVGRRLLNGLDIALSGTYERSDGMTRLYFPAFASPASNGGVAQGLDGSHVADVYAHVGFRGVTLTAAYGNRQKFVPTASFGTVFNQQDPRQQTTDRHTLVDLHYDRTVGSTKVAAGAAFDRYYTDGIYPFPNDPSGAPLVNHDHALGARWSVDGRVTRPLAGSQLVTVGGEFLNHVHQDQWDTYVDPAGPAFTIDRSSIQSAVYAQDEIAPRRWLRLNGGLRYDEYETFHRLTPSAAIIYLPSPNESFKYLYGQAFRAPNVYELTFYSKGIPNTNLRPESINTQEVVWERYFAGSLRTSASAYWYQADHLITLISLGTDAAEFNSLAFANVGQVRAKGLEFEAETRFRGGVLGRVSYALQHTDNVLTGDTLTNSPRQMAKVRLSVPGPARGSFVSVETQYLSRRATLSGSSVAPAAVINLTVNHPLARSLVVYGSVYNLFDQHYADPVSAEFQQDAIEQNGRTLRVGLKWTFGREPGP